MTTVVGPDHPPGLADIRRFPFTLHLRSNPTNYVIHTRKGALAHRGAGAASFFRPLNAAISEVPIAESELSMLLRAGTVDFQEVCRCRPPSPTSSATRRSPPSGSTSPSTCTAASGSASRSSR